MPLISMTGFASQDVTVGGQMWLWDVRSVNSRALDLKLRLPDGIDGLEPMVRARVGELVRRGSVTVSLRRGPSTAGGGMPDAATLDRVFTQLLALEAAAGRAGLRLAPLNVADLLDGRLVPRGDGLTREAGQALARALAPSLDSTLAAFVEMRQREGTALGRHLSLAFDLIARRVAEARRLDKLRTKDRSASLLASVRRLVNHAPEVEPARLEQELALLAVKADITEELERLEAHVAAARAMLEQTAPVGRKLDFLTQELNREANTLCSKAQYTELTRVGLDLKTAIDQVKEQAQNLE